jgi:hypothetical protein
MAEALDSAQRGIGAATNVFDARSNYLLAAAVHLGRNDLPAARKVLAESRAAGLMTASFQVLEALISGRAGMWDKAGRLLTFAEPSLELSPVVLMFAMEISLARGEVERALGFGRRPIFQDISAAHLRLNPALHPLLDYAPFAPRVTPMTLVWPAEAPPVAPEIAALFAGVRVESGMPTPTGT